MKKSKKTIIATILSVILLATLAVFAIFQRTQNTEIRKFSIDDYSQEINTFSSVIEKSYGQVNTVEDAKKVAEKVIDEVYRQDGIFLGTTKPYQVLFDDKNQVWLVQATLLFSPGSGVHVLINKSDGKILATWNYKL